MIPLRASAPQREFPPVTKHQAFRDLALTECACGARKNRMMSHCRSCYFKLPRAMGKALYNTHDSYVGPYNASLKFLGLQSPSQREDEAHTQGIKSGTQAVILETEARR